MEEKEQIKISNGWLVDIVTLGKGYRIERIQAQLGYKVYLPIDTSNFTKDQWDMFHELCHMGRIETGEESD